MGMKQKHRASAILMMRSQHLPHKAHPCPLSWRSSNTCWTTCYHTAWHKELCLSQMAILHCMFLQLSYENSALVKRSRLPIALPGTCRGCCRNRDSQPCCSYRIHQSAGQKHPCYSWHLPRCGSCSTTSCPNKAKAGLDTAPEAPLC